MSAGLVSRPGNCSGRACDRIVSVGRKKTNVNSKRIKGWTFFIALLLYFVKNVKTFKTVFILHTLRLWRFLRSGGKKHLKSRAQSGKEEHLNFSQSETTLTSPNFPKLIPFVYFVCLVGLIDTIRKMPLPAKILSTARPSSGRACGLY